MFYVGNYFLGTPARNRNRELDAVHGQSTVSIRSTWPGGGSTPDSSLLFEVCRQLWLKNEHGLCVCLPLSIDPYNCSIMLMTCFLLFFFFHCRFFSSFVIFTSHYDCRLSSHHYFLFFFVIFTDRCKWTRTARSCSPYTIPK